MSPRNEDAREGDDARMTRRAARGDVNGDDTRTVTREMLRPFSANRSGDPNVRMSHGPTRLVEEATACRISRQAARWRRHIATIYCGDPSTSFETSPATRVIDQPERMMAPTLNNPAASTVPDSSHSRR